MLQADVTARRQMPGLQDDHQIRAAGERPRVRMLREILQGPAQRRRRDELVPLEKRDHPSPPARRHACRTDEKIRM